MTRITQTSGTAKIASKSNMKKLLTTSTLVAAGAMAFASGAMAAGPTPTNNVWNLTQGANDVGSFTVDTSASNVTNIDAYSPNAHGFTSGQGDLDIPVNHTVNVNQNASSTFVARDTENDPTEIMGSLNSDGKIFIIDENGVFFGATAQINVGGILATTGDLDTATLYAGGDANITFDASDNASIINNGTITVADAGLAAFVSPFVTNNGIINAKMGTVQMAAGQTVTLDLYGDGLYEVAVDGEMADALLDNQGTINAEGGKVAMTAKAAKGVADTIINMDGVTDVSSFTVEGGKIIIGGGDKGTVKVGGTLDASGENGGTVDVSGQVVKIAAGSNLRANGGTNGDGGIILAKGIDNIEFQGNIEAMGGSAAGNGGHVEVSGGTDMLFTGTVNTLAPFGLAGSLLLDPSSLTIYNGANAVNMLNSNTVASLLGHNGSVTVQAGTVNVGGDGAVDLSTYDETTTTQTWINSGYWYSWHHCGWGGCYGGGYWVNTSHWAYSTTTQTYAADGNLALNGGSVNFVDNLTMGAGNLDVAATAGDVNWNANVTMNGGTIYATATGDQNIAGSIQVKGTGSFTAEAGNDITVTAPISSYDAGGSVVLDAGNDVSVSGTTIRTYGGEDITVNAGGTLYMTNTDFTSWATPGSIFMTGGALNATNAQLRAYNITGDFTNDLTLGAGAKVVGFGGAVHLSQGGVLTADADSILNSGTIEIDQNNGGSIQTAINAISGSYTAATLNVGAGTYNEDVVVDLNNFDLLGTGSRTTIIQGQSTAYYPNALQINPNIHDVKVDGFQFRGVGHATAMLRTGNNNITLSNNTFIAPNDGIALETEGGISNVNISNNVFGTSRRGTNKSLVYINGNVSVSNPSTNINWDGNLFTGMAGAGLTTEQTGGDITNNVFSGDFGTSLNLLGAVGNVTGNNFSGDNRGLVVFSFDGDATNKATLTDDNTFIKWAQISAGTGEFAWSPLGGSLFGYIGTAVDKAGAGATVDVSEGTFNEGNINITKNLLISGAGKNKTIVDANGFSNGFVINSDLGNTNTTIRRMTVENASNAGLSVGYGGALKVLTLNQTAFNDNGYNGVAVYGNGLKDLRILNSNFLNNGGANGSSGDGDILAYLYNGDVTLNNVDVQNNTAANTADYGIQIRGAGAPDAVTPSGTITMNNVSVAGNYRAALVGVQRYSDLALSMTDVTLGGQTDAGTDSAGWGSLYLSELGGANVDIGNTSFDAVNGQYILLGGEAGSPDVDARDAIFEGVVGNAATLAESFAIEDKVFHDMDNPTSGHVTWQDGVFFVTTNTLGIQNAINIANAGDTVNVDDGTYTEDLLIDKALKLTGHGTTLQSNGGANLITVTADNVNIDPFVFDGLGVAQFGITSIATDGLVVDGNTFQNFVDSNIWLLNNTNALITGNTINGAMNGILFAGGADNTATGNTLSGLDGTGIYSYDNAVRTTITGNTISMVTGAAAHWYTAGIWAWGGSDHTITGNIIDGGTTGIGVDGADRTTVSANTIGGTTAVAGDNIYVGNTYKAWVKNNTTTGGENGLYAENASDLKVSGNTINGATVTGIHVTNSNGTGHDGAGKDVDIWGNTVNSAAGATGILVENSNYATIGADSLNPYGSGFSGGNKVSGGADGIVVKNSDNAVVLYSTVHDVDGQGVNVEGGSDVIVSANDIDNTGSNGIRIYGVSGGEIQSNTINNAGANGIATIDSDDLHINSVNVIDGTYAAGITMNGTTNSTIEGNLVSNTGGAGLWLKDANGATVLRNMIYGTWNNASRAYGAGVTVLSTDGVKVLGNTIDNTKNGGDGIEVQNSSSVNIAANQIGTNTGPNNISGEGIDVDNSAGTQFFRNRVRNTVSNGIAVDASANSGISSNYIGNIGGDGIQVTNSNGVGVNSNSVMDTDGNGIFLEASNNSFVRTNTVRHVDLAGIRVDNADNVTVNQRNSINGTGLAGIGLHGVTNSLINSNSVFNTDGSGIWGDAIDGTTISGNTVNGTWMNASNGTGSGVYVKNSDGVTVYRNFIDNTNNGGDGVTVTNTKHAQIIDNRIGVNGGVSNISGDGVNVSDKSGHALVRGNVIRNTGDNGIEVDHSGYAQILTNSIKHAAHNGIDVNHGVEALVQGNNIFSILSDGIHVEHNDGLNVLGNVVGSTDADGIDVHGGSDVTISGNFVGVNPGAGNTLADNIGDNGIEVSGVDTVTVYSNTIANADNDGIHAESNDDLRITDNVISDIGDDGIDVRRSDEANIRRNQVLFSGDDAIHVENSDFADIVANFAIFNGDDGIDVSDSFGVNVKRNLVGFSRDNGIQVTDSAFVSVDRNAVAFTGGNGIFAGDNDAIRIRRNNVVFAGNNGIAAYGNGLLRVVGNDVSESENNGIDVGYSYGPAYILNNTVYDNGADGIGVRFVPHAEIVGNEIYGNGDDGIDASYINTPTTLIVADNEIHDNADNGVVVNNSLSTEILNNLIYNNGSRGLFMEGAYNNSIVLAGNTFIDNPIGAEFQSGRIDLTGDTNTFIGGDVALFFNPAEIYGRKPRFPFPGQGPLGDGPFDGPIGGPLAFAYPPIPFEPTYADMSLVGNTIGTTTFEGQSTYYIELANGAFFNPGTPTVINGLNATYDGINPASQGGWLTQKQFDRIEAGIFHFTDLKTLGLFFFGAVPDNIDQEDLFRSFGLYFGPNGGLNVTITGLPGLSQADLLAQIAPAAGNTAESLADLEPAAGGDDTSCWSDAVNGAGNGQSTTYSFGNDPESALSDATGCQSGNI